MSYILDALRRAEHERRRTLADPMDQISAEPDLTDPEPRQWLVRWLLPAVLAVLLATAIALAWWHAFGSHTTKIPLMVPAGDGPTAPAAPASPTMTPTTKSTAPAAPAPVRQPISPIPDAAHLSRLSELVPPPPKPRTRPSPKTTTAASPDATAAIPMTAPETTTPRTQTPAATTSSKPTPTAALKAMPETYRSSFPDIHVEVHVYDADPAKRWVLIDGTRYKTGDQLPAGPKIDAIVPQGTVFQWKGQRVLYPLTP